MQATSLASMSKGSAQFLLDPRTVTLDALHRHFIKITEVVDSVAGRLHTRKKDFRKRFDARVEILHATRAPEARTGVILHTTRPRRSARVRKQILHST